MVNIFYILKRHHWDIGLIYQQSDDTFLDVSKIHIIKNPYRKTTWFADPFILDITEDSVILLVEEFTYSINRGRIAKLTVDRKRDTITKCEILLDLETHLSFPAIIRNKGSIYVYPENSASGNSSLYLYQNGKLEKAGLLSHEPLTDAVIEYAMNAPIMFSTKVPTPNGYELGIYRSDDYVGEYKHVQTIKFEDRVARNAGEVFEKDGMLIRPAQIFQGKYGYGMGICFQKVNEVADNISFDEICRIYPPEGYDGMHTFNQYKGVAVVDLRKYNHPAVHSLLSKIKNIIHKR